jgi:hypothetical protein
MPGLSLGDLEEASRAAPQSAEEAGAHLRALARSRMQGAGRVVDPQFVWDDLMVPADLEKQLRRIAFEARARPTLMQDAESARLFAGTGGIVGAVRRAFRRRQVDGGAGDRARARRQPADRRSRHHDQQICRRDREEPHRHLSRARTRPARR